MILFCRSSWCRRILLELSAPSHITLEIIFGTLKNLCGGRCFSPIVCHPVRILPASLPHLLFSFAVGMRASSPDTTVDVERPILTCHTRTACLLVIGPKKLSMLKRYYKSRGSRQEHWLERAGNCKASEERNSAVRHKSTVVA